MDKFIHLHFFALVFEDTTAFKEAYLAKDLWPAPEDCPEEVKAKMPTEPSIAAWQEFVSCSHADAVQYVNLGRVIRYLEWKSDMPSLFD